MSSQDDGVAAKKSECLKVTGILITFSQAFTWNPESDCRIPVFHVLPDLNEGFLPGTYACRL